MGRWITLVVLVFNLARSGLALEYGIADLPSQGPQPTLVRYFLPLCFILLSAAATEAPGYSEWITISQSLWTPLKDGRWTMQTVHNLAGLSRCLGGALWSSGWLEGHISNQFRFSISLSWPDVWMLHLYLFWTCLPLEGDPMSNSTLLSHLFNWHWKPPCHPMDMASVNCWTINDQTITKLAFIMWAMT